MIPFLLGDTLHRKHKQRSDVNYKLRVGKFQGGRQSFLWSGKCKTHSSFSFFFVFVLPLFFDGCWSVWEGEEVVLVAINILLCSAQYISIFLLGGCEGGCF